MIVTKEFFEEEVKKVKEIQPFKPRYIKIEQNSEQIIKTLNKAELSQNAKIELIKVLNYIKENKSRTNLSYNNILIYGDYMPNNMGEMITTFFANEQICSNIIYDEFDEAIKYFNDSVLLKGVALIDFSKKYRDIERKILNIRKIRNSVIMLTFISNEDFTDFGTHLRQSFPFIIENNYSDEEKYKFVKSILKEFNVKMTTTKQSFLNQAENLSVVKIKTYLPNFLLNLNLKQKTIFSLDSFNHYIKTGEIKEISIKKSIINNKELSQKQENFNDVIGLENVKKQVKRIISYFKKNKNNLPNLHMAFLGNPGTGKTTIARIIGEELKQAGILNNNIFIETDRSGLIGEYVGHTAQKTKRIIDEAKGGVLFIDEAYSLFYEGSKKDFGQECISTIVKEMEDKRGEFMIIFAGYKEEMDKLLNSNKGLDSRVQFKIEFEDYDINELMQIFNKFLKQNGYGISKKAKEALMDYFKEQKVQKNFSNGRFVRNVFEQLLLIQSERPDDFKIKECDIKALIEEQKKEIKTSIGF